MDTVAVIAHDSRKSMMLKWVERHQNELSKFNIVTTGTTGKLIEESLKIKVKRFKSGPLGGDQQIGASIVEGRIAAILFFWDPLAAMPHDPDVKALLRLATLYNIPMACNEASADFIFSSPLWSQGYQPNQELLKAYESARSSFKAP